MSNATAKKAIMMSIQTRTLGNSKRGLKELASDLIAEYGVNATKNIAENAYLSKVTVDRVLECEEHYQPRLDTVERILRVMGCRLNADYISIKGAFMPQPKE